ncbi:MAG: alpha-glucan family phosphorylase [Candidatus Kapabacteria bacterium]|nr:alpha-glucan family phosphorylase [Candidatus Kapabacteria bacterium]
MVKPINSFVVTAKLPKRIACLRELAMNFWWCWNSEAKEIFVRIDRDLWDEVNHNPVQLINRIGQKALEELATQQDFVSYLDYIYAQYKQYMNADSWWNTHQNTKTHCVAYFSTEYGINESFPNYSGGLGILSGDHLKSSSDLGLPLVGVGLLYQQGYFRQHLMQNGWQTESYNYNDFYSMALEEVFDRDGKALLIEMQFPKGRVYTKVWKLAVGRVTLFLLDTNISENLEEYRDITDQLYGGDRETRIQQEIVLGVGGMRALMAMGIEPEVVHINEGHAAFALLERTRVIMQKFGVDFQTAVQISKSSSVFTTHTPVPAGNEAFEIDRIKAYFTIFLPKIGISEELFTSLGQISGQNDGKFSMTILGLKMTAYHNGVSKLHGEVSRKMWHELWADFPEKEVPIDHITNGIHTMTWVARELRDLYDRYLSPRWRIDPSNADAWKNIDIIPAEEIWREKLRRRVRLVLFARGYLKIHQRNFLGAEEICKIDEYLDPDALTIGFARRFATYKRALLLFSNMERLTKILNNPDKPVQIIIAGKAHPHDTQGKEVIQAIIAKIREYHLERKIVFLEDYDMIIARFLVKGCDVWLNNPIRPMEASGTSGMKAALNGTLNCSILDGWWDEAYNGENGFAIGNGEEYDNPQEQDIIEAGALYDTLENAIVETFYDREDFRGLPERWIKMMKNAIKTIAPEFSTARMIKDYTEMFYLNAGENYAMMTAENGALAREIMQWKNTIAEKFPHAKITKVEMVKQSVTDMTAKNILPPEEMQSAVTGVMPVPLVPPVPPLCIPNGGLCTTSVPLVPLVPRVCIRFGEKCTDSKNYVGEQVSLHIVVDLAGLSSNDVIVQILYGAVNAQGEISNPRVADCNLIAGTENEYEGSFECSDAGMQGYTCRLIPYRKELVRFTDMFKCTWA